MAKFINYNYLLSLIIQYLNFCSQIKSIPYDSSFTSECLEEPLDPQYNGGIVENSELNEGLKGWTTFANATIEHRSSVRGNKYIIASNRSESIHSFSQNIYLKRDHLYTFSAWLRLGDKKAEVAAILKTKKKNVTVGWATARKGCWSMLKGGLDPKTSGPAQLYFWTSNTQVDIWGDSFSLQQFTHQEWTSHQHRSIQKVRKTSVKIQVLDEAGRPVPNATISLTQKRRDFCLGCAINQNILTNTRYQNWFLSRFKQTCTVFENELKWSYNEPSSGVTNYHVPDAMARFAETNTIKIRGHCVHWNHKNFQPAWVNGLSRQGVLAAAERRIDSVVSRYKNKFIHWDVDNENIHNNFFEATLNYPDVSSLFYQRANKIDARATLFLNEFNTIEEPTDSKASPQKYLEKIRKTQKHGYKGSMGIGVQGHFRVLNKAYIRASLDILWQARLPLWITELDVVPGPKQAPYLKEILQELYSHKAVDGMILWSAWSPTGCYKMCLTDNNFVNLETGKVVDAFTRQLTQADDPELRGRMTDSNGFFEASLNHGVYQVQVSHPNGHPSSNLKQINVRPNVDQVSLVYRVTINY